MILTILYVYLIGQIGFWAFMSFVGIRDRDQNDTTVAENIFAAFLAAFGWPYLAFRIIKTKINDPEAKAKRAQFDAIKRAKLHSKETDKAIALRKKYNPTMEDELEKIKQEIYK